MEKVSLDIFSRKGTVGNCQKFSGFVQSPIKGLKKDAVKNACDGVATAMEFIKTGSYFYLKLLFLSYSFGLTH